MRALRIHQRGGPEQLRYEDAPSPVPRPGDALVRVHAAGITPAELTWDASYHHPDGSPRTPSIPGHEVSGVVEALADGARGVAAGDEVFALTDFFRDGAAAELVSVAVSSLAPKPRRLDHVQAAALPLAGLTAWQALFDRGGLRSGKRVLIHGAAGGVGTLAVQLARWRQAYVIGTASARNLEFVRKLGAHEAIDYAAERFEDRVRDIDVVVDLVGGDTAARSAGVLKRDGILVRLTAPPPAGEPGVFFIVEPNRGELERIARLADAGILKPVVAEAVPLERGAEAFRRSASGHNRGKHVITAGAA